MLYRNYLYRLRSCKDCQGYLHYNDGLALIAGYMIHFRGWIMFLLIYYWMITINDWVLLHYFYLSSYSMLWIPSTWWCMLRFFLLYIFNNGRWSQLLYYIYTSIFIHSYLVLVMSDLLITKNGLSSQDWCELDSKLY